MINFLTRIPVIESGVGDSAYFITRKANIPRSLLIIIRDNEVDPGEEIPLEGKERNLVITRFPIIRRQVQILRSWPITRCSMAITICKVNEGTLRSTRTPNNSSNLHTDIGVIRRKLVTGTAIVWRSQRRDSPDQLPSFWTRLY